MNPYGVDTRESNVQGPICSLDLLFESMPGTGGCENCEKNNGIDGKDWCCQKQSPSMYYIEFLNVYAVVEKWSKEKRTKLVLRAIRNYLDNSLSKGCIFYDEGCTAYEKRPVACRLYGIIPQESWQIRWEALKVRQGERFEAMPQCDLVTADEEVTVEMERKWLDHALKCEQRIGVPINQIHDEAGGSYRTFHDHLLLELFDEPGLEFLTKVRLMNPSKKDIDLTVEQIQKLL